MATRIHPTAIIDPEAYLDENVEVGPYCVLGPGAFIASGTKLMNHVTICGNVRMGHDNIVYPYGIYGAEPQDYGYKGEPTWVVIGDRNVFREGVQVHRATTKEMGVTRIGNDNYFMGYTHMAHDVIIGNHCNLANGCVLAGHVQIKDHAILSGMVGVHHFTTIGQYSFVGGMSRITTDVPPFMLVEGHPSVVRFVNMVGLKRQGFQTKEIQNLSEAHRLLYRMKMGATDARAALQERGPILPRTEELFDFLNVQRQGRNGRARDGRRMVA